MSSDLRDEDLLHRFRETRCGASFRELVSRHAGFVLATARRQLGAYHLWADDVAQQVWIDLARRAPGFPSGFGLPGWLYRQTCRRAANAVRSEVRRLRREGLATTSGISAPEREALDATAILSHLPKADADLLVSRFLNGRSVRALAAEGAASEEAVRKRLTRALHRARELARARGWSMVLLGSATATESEAITAETCARTAERALKSAAGPGITAAGFAGAVRWALAAGAAAGFAVTFATTAPPTGASPSVTPGSRVRRPPKPPTFSAGSALMALDLTPPATVDEAIGRLREVEQWHHRSAIRSEMLDWLARHLPRTDDAAMVRESILRLRESKSVVFGELHRWMDGGHCQPLLQGLAEARRELVAKGLDFDAYPGNEVQLLGSIVKRMHSPGNTKAEEIAAQLAADYPALADFRGQASPLTAAVAAAWLKPQSPEDGWWEWLSTRPVEELRLALANHLPLGSGNERTVRAALEALNGAQKLPTELRTSLEDTLAGGLLSFQPLEEVERQLWPEIRATLGWSRVLAACGDNVPPDRGGFGERWRTEAFWNEAWRSLDAAAENDRASRIDVIVDRSAKLWRLLTPEQTAATVHRLLEAVPPDHREQSALRLISVLRRLHPYECNASPATAQELVAAVGTPGTLQWLVPALAQEGFFSHLDPNLRSGAIDERLTEITAIPAR